MVEDIVDVRAKLEGQALRGMEILVDSQVYAPRSRSPKHVALGHLGIAEHVGTYGRQTKGIRIKNAVAALFVEVVANHRGTIRWLRIEIANGVHGGDTNIAGFNRIAIVADPERCESGSRFREHVKRSLPSTRDEIRPFGH